MKDRMAEGVALLLEDAYREIDAVRRHNEILGAQVRVIAVFEAALIGRPGGAHMFAGHPASTPRNR